MNNNFLVIISLTLFSMILCQGQNKMHNIKEIAVNEFYKDYVETMKGFGKQDVKISDVEESTQLDTTFNDLFLSTQISVYTFLKVEPNHKLILYKNKNEEGFFDDSYFMKDEIISKKLISKVNIFLKDENDISKTGLNQLIGFMLYTKYKKSNSIIILNNWEQIPYDEQNIIPPHIKNIIEPPKEFIENNDTLSMKLFCWDKYTTILYEGLFTYSYLYKTINVELTKIAKVGIPSVSI